MPLRKTFRAQVSARVLDKAPRFFNGGLGDIFNELLQNARRAGASGVQVETLDTEQGVFVVVRDDGCGVADPKTLLTLGGSDWEDGIQASEDPAGIGVFALAMRGARIASRRHGSRTGWSVNLVREHFEGKADASILPSDIERGTEIRFPLLTHESAESELCKVVRYYPIPVCFNGDPVEQERFLGGAIRQINVDGVTIGVFAGRLGYCQDTINFHGVTIRHALPSVSNCFDSKQDLHVKFDVRTCTDLKLVLPTRKEIVEDRFFENLKRAAEHAMYSVLKDYSWHTLPFASWRRASELGVDLDEARPALRAFVPYKAHDEFDEWGNLVPLLTGQSAIVVEHDEPPTELCLVRAVEQSRDDLLLLEAEPRYVGYSWYDRLSKLKEVDWAVRQLGVETLLEDYAPRAGEARPDEIYAALTIEEAGKPTTAVRLSADLVFSGDPSCIEEVEPVVSSSSTICTGELSDCIFNAYFSPSDDYDAGHYDDQRRRAEQDAQAVALTILVSAEAAEHATLRDELFRTIFWRLPRDRRTAIHVEGSDIRIRSLPLSARERYRRLVRYVAPKLSTFKKALRSRLEAESSDDGR